jgi:hypothetical protein
LIPPELRESYRRTRFIVFDPPMEIRIGELCPALDALLTTYGFDNWAFITAHNPASIVLPDAENTTRHLQLFEMLASYPCFEGEGVPPDPGWKPERSLLVLGIEWAEAEAIGRSFGQNAIVVGRVGERAELRILG